MTVVGQITTSQSSVHLSEVRENLFVHLCTHSANIMLTVPSAGLGVLRYYTHSHYEKGTVIFSLVPKS